MSIEKLNFNSVIQEKLPYTVYLNKIVQNIKDPVAGYIWVFLSTCCPTWEVNKEHLMKHFSLGRDKLEKKMSYLKNIGLIDYLPTRRSDGTVSKWSILVKADSPYFSQFINTTENQGSSVLSTPLKIKAVDNPHTYKNKTVLKKKIINKTKKPFYIFSCLEDVKSYIEETAAHRSIDLTSSLVKQVLFYINESLETEEVKKKVNIALKLIKQKKWNVPTGFEQPSPTSTAEKEKEYNDNKQKQYKEDKFALERLSNPVNSDATPVPALTLTEEEQELLAEYKQGARYNKPELLFDKKPERFKAAEILYQLERNHYNANTGRM